MRRIGHWLVVLALLLLPPTAHAQTRPDAALQAGVSSLPLSRHVEFFHDGTGRADAADAFAAAARGRFRPLPNAEATFGFRDGAWWFRARIVNRDHHETRWLLVQEYPLSDHIDVYARYPGGRIAHQAAGDVLPFSARAIKYRHPNFWLDLPRGEPVELLVRVQSQSSMQVPLALYTPGAFAEYARDAQLGIGLYYGILLALFFYNLVLWLSLRDHSYFWYMLHVTAFGLVLFCLNGLGFEYLWPNSPWLADKCVPLSICLAQMAMHQFARKFLELDERWPLGNRVCVGLIVVFGLLLIAALALPYRISTPIASRGVFVSILWIVIVTIVVVRRGYTPAKLLLLAWSMFLLGTAAYVLVAFAVLPKTFITEYGVQIGSALEMILLSIALGYRYAALRNRNEQLVRDANEQLERSVARRTAELSSALEQLGEANGRLRESSRRDALTGVYNRSYFHESFERILRDAREQGRPVALLMADLDYFKQVNDTYGHLVGDDCLRRIARCLEDTLAEPGAVVARFGGEEFVAVLPGLDVRAAMQAGETLRQRVAAQPFRAGGREVRMTISIGVHVIDTRADSRAEDAIRIADEALYAAKEHGRDCVRPALTAI